MTNNPPIEENRNAPTFVASDFCLQGCDDPAEMQHTYNELMNDYQPTQAIQVILIQRIALKHQESLASARLRAGVVQRNLDVCIEEETAAGKQVPTGPHEAGWTALLGRALVRDTQNGNAFTRAVNSATPSDREFHRSVKELNRLDSLRQSRTIPERKPAAPADKSTRGKPASASLAG